MRFKGKGTDDIFNGVDSVGARRTLPRNLHARAARLLDRLNAAVTPNDLRCPPGNRLEKLTGNRKGQWSLRINENYRICFTWNEREAQDVEIVDYH